jgi:hypothetical protein
MSHTSRHVDGVEKIIIASLASEAFYTHGMDGVAYLFIVHYS